MSPTHRFSVYGLDFATDYSFRSRLLPGAGKPDFVFEAGLDLGSNWQREFRHVYSSVFRDAKGDSVFRLFEADGIQLLRFTDQVDFLLGPDSIQWGRVDADEAHGVESYFLSPVLAYWLERSGVLAVHASAVAFAGDVVALVAPTGGGKSSLATALVFAGYPLVTDDLLPIAAEDDVFHVRAGYPQIKVNPDTGRYYLGEEFFDLPHYWPPLEKRLWSFAPTPDRFKASGGPIRCIYLLDRAGGATAGGEPRIQELTKRAALMELLRATFTPILVEGVGLAASRFSRLAELVQRVPVRRLSYGSDLERLPEVVEAAVRDMAAGK